MTRSTNGPFANSGLALRGTRKLVHAPTRHVNESDALLDTSQTRQGVAVTATKYRTMPPEARIDRHVKLHLRGINHILSTAVRSPPLLIKSYNVGFFATSSPELDSSFNRTVIKSVPGCPKLWDNQARTILTWSRSPRCTTGYSSHPDGYTSDSPGRQTGPRQASPPPLFGGD
jgi:hypothetical protein